MFCHTVSKSTGPRMTENLHQSPLNQRRPVALFSTELSFQAFKLENCDLFVWKGQTEKFGPIYTFYQN